MAVFSLTNADEATITTADGRTLVVSKDKPLEVKAGDAELLEAATAHPALQSDKAKTKAPTKVEEEGE